MTPLMRGAAIAVAQVALVACVGGKLLYDRATLPRAWIETAGVDPDLPIRGRYVSLNLVLPAVLEAPLPPPSTHALGRLDAYAYGRIELHDGRAVAVLSGGDPIRDEAHPHQFIRLDGDGADRWRTSVPIAYFLPEHVRDPTLDRRPGELWVEATLPRRGAPRPLRLGVERDGRIEPLG